MIKIDQFAAANEAAIDQFSQFARVSLANFEKFSELGLGAARASLLHATEHAQAMAGARDVQEAFALGTAAVEPAFKRGYALSREAFTTAAETAEQFQRAFEKQANEANEAAIAAIEESLKYAPAGSETVVGNVKSAMAAARSAYDNALAANRQFVATVEKAVEQNVAAAKKAAPKSRRAN